MNNPGVFSVSKELADTSRVIAGRQGHGDGEKGNILLCVCVCVCGV